MRTHARARRLILKVTETGQAKLTVPPRTPRAQIDAFLAQHHDWLLRTVNAARLSSPQLATDAPPDALQLVAVDEHWRLEFVARSDQVRTRSQLRPSTAPGLFTLRVTHAAEREDLQSELRHAVRRELVRRAKGFYADALGPLAEHMGVRFKRLQVRNQRSVWGSCSSSGTLSLNMAGLFLPPRLARYLCIHELAHLRHMNHSSAFWDLVCSVEPNAKVLDAQLGGTSAVLPRWLW
ncbi:MAG: YgjP-like metallopeptidase domain-containing protein [Pseudomonadota bacterium]